MSQESGAAPVDLGPEADSGANSATLLGLIQRGHSFSGHEPHCLFLNLGQERFANVSAASHFDFDDDGRALGRVDWDHDGDLDFWIANRSSPQVRFLRNDMPRNHHFLKLRLRSSGGNRDGIGASVEVVPTGKHEHRFVKTLRAGDGYLSQSSKWLHFGLGALREIDSIVVRWPRGRVRTYRGLECDGHYLIHEDNDIAEPWNPPQRAVNLQPVEVRSQPPSADVNTFTMSQTPLVPLPYSTLDGTEAPLFDPSPTLVLLWSQTCPTCLTELADLSKRKDDIRRSGLSVVALNGDRLRSSEAQTLGLPSNETIRQSLQELQFPFQAGVATTEILDLLQLVNDHIYDLNLPLPVPAGFLVDRQGRLTSIYKGRLDIDQVLRDVANGETNLETKRNLAVPFTGKWAEPPVALSFRPLIAEMIARNMLDTADKYVRLPLPVAKDELFQLVYRVGMSLVEAGRFQQAEEHFAALRRIDPQNVQVELVIGERREQEGHAQEAFRLYREAVRRSPRNVSALNNLAWLLATNDELRDGPEAIRFARQAVELTRESEPAILDTLAAAYAADKKFERAVAVLDSAIKIAEARNDLHMAESFRSHRQRCRDKKYIQP